MVHEIATLSIDAAKCSEFEAAVAKAEPLFRADPGCTGFALRRIVETPGVYQLVVGWETVEAHMHDFRESEAFQQWRALVSPYFAAPPSVIHTEAAIGKVTVE